MSNKRNDKIIENFNSAQTISKLAEVLSAQKSDPIISADELYKKAVMICGLGDHKLNFYDISKNVKKFEDLISQYSGYGYEKVVDDIAELRKAFLKQLVENVSGLNEALILFNEISDFDTCIFPEDSNILITFDKKIGSFCLDRKNIRNILTDLSGFLKKDWRDSSRVEISKFYQRLYEKFCVIFFIGIKDCDDFIMAVKYLERVYFNLPYSFKVTDGMNKIISSEELINKFAELCSKDANDDKEILSRCEKIATLIISIEKESIKNSYFCDQLKKRACAYGCSAETDDIDDCYDEMQYKIIEEEVSDISLSDILVFDSEDNSLDTFYDFCNCAKNKNGNKSEIYFIANALKILIGENFDHLPDPYTESDDAVLWGRTLYKAVYDSHFNETNQNRIISVFSEGIPAVCKTISSFLKMCFDKKISLSSIDFAAVCIAYPNTISKPYYIDAEKAINFVGEHNSELICNFVQFCIDNDYTRIENVSHILKNNSDKEGWQDAYETFCEDDEDGDEYNGINRGIWFIVLIIILLIAGAAYYFFFYSRSEDDKEQTLPTIVPNTSTSISVTTTATEISDTKTTNVETTATNAITSSVTASSGEKTTTTITETSETKVETTKPEHRPTTTTKPSKETTTTQTETTTETTDSTTQTTSSQTSSSSASTTIDDTTTAITTTTTTITSTATTVVHSTTSATATQVTSETTIASTSEGTAADTTYTSAFESETTEAFTTTSAVTQEAIQ